MTDEIRNGLNVLSCSRRQDASGLFSQYVVIGQATNPLSELSVDANQLSESVANSAVSRQRVSVTLQSGNAIPVILKKRAMIRKNQAIGESDVLTYTVHGWRCSDGALWGVNKIVSIRDTQSNLNLDMVISSVTLTASRSGMSTVLECKNALAFFDLDLSKDSDVKDVFGDVKRLSGKVGGASWTKK